MKAVLVALFASLRAGFLERAALHLEVLAVRHQLAVYQRRHQRVRTKVADRLLWSMKLDEIGPAKIEEFKAKKLAERQAKKSIKNHLTALRKS